MAARAFITGLEGLTLSANERAFLRDSRPWGLIIFKRNVSTPDQVTELIQSFRDIAGSETPVLVDQEGGRVQRLRPPYWRTFPAGREYGQLKTNDPLYRREITRLGGRLLAHDLRDLGVNVDCIPVLDVPSPGGHDIIGDRAYGEDVETVATLGRAAQSMTWTVLILCTSSGPANRHTPGTMAACA